MRTRTEEGKVNEQGEDAEEEKMSQFVAERYPLHKAQDSKTSAIGKDSDEDDEERKENGKVFHKVQAAPHLFSLEALKEFNEGKTAARNQETEIDERGEVGKVSEEDGTAVSVHHAEGKKNQRQGGQCIAEGNESKRRHEQKRGKDERQIVDCIHNAALREARQAVRAADPLEAMDPDERAPEGFAQFGRGKFAMGDESRQPEFSREQMSQAKEQDARAEHGADAGNRNRHQEDQRHEDGEEHQTVHADDVHDLIQRDFVRRQFPGDQFDLLAKRFGIEFLFLSRG